jgi:hypothetical protein
VGPAREGGGPELPQGLAAAGVDPDSAESRQVADIGATLLQAGQGRDELGGPEQRARCGWRWRTFDPGGGRRLGLEPGPGRGLGLLSRRQIGPRAGPKDLDGAGEECEDILARGRPRGAARHRRIDAGPWLGDLTRALCLGPGRRGPGLPGPNGPAPEDRPLDLAALGGPGQPHRDLGQDATFDQLAVQLVVDPGQLHGGLALELLEQGQGELIRHPQLPQGREHGLEQGPGVERILVLADPREVQQGRHPALQGRELIGAVAGCAGGELVDGEIALEVLGGDEAQLAQVRGVRQTPAPVQGGQAGIELGHIDGAEFLQQGLTPVGKEVRGGEVELLVLQAGGPIRHAKQVVVGLAQVPGEGGGDPMDEAIPAQGEQTARLGGEGNHRGGRAGRPEGQHVGVSWFSHLCRPRKHGKAHDP